MHCTTATASCGADHAGPASVRVLIVEDHPAMRDLLREIVEDLGATALTATGHDAALAVARREPVDLVLTDVMLGPGPSGLALAETLRGERPDLDIIIVSAARAEADAGRLASQGIDFWEKPLDLDRLAQRIAARR